EHVWTPAIRSSLYGHFSAVSFDDTAKFIICNSPQSPIRSAATLASVGFNHGILPGCNPNFEVWDVGSRTIWNPVSNLDIGVDVIYAQINNHYDTADRKSTRLNSSHSQISYAVFCLKKKSKQLKM